MSRVSFHVYDNKLTQGFWNVLFKMNSQNNFSSGALLEV
jgi:hypothetical protein